MNVAEQLKTAVVEALKPVLKPLVIKIVNTIVFPILDEKVKESVTKIDDLVWASAKISVAEAIEKAEF